MHHGNIAGVAISEQIRANAAPLAALIDRIASSLFGEPGRSGSESVWAADGDRVLLGEEHVPRSGPREYAQRVFSLATKKTTDVKLPYGCWVTGWTPDGKQFLVTIRPDDETSRFAWVPVDGAVKPDYITAADRAAWVLGSRHRVDGWPSF